MEAKDFKRWRKSLGMTQKDETRALGLKPSMIQYYEKGERDGESVKVPRSIRLACYALAHGITDYQSSTRPPPQAMLCARRVLLSAGLASWGHFSTV